MKHIVIEKERAGALGGVLEYGKLCSDEYAMAKFKEVWEDGNRSGFYDGFNGEITSSNSEKDWNEFKKTL